MGSTPTDPKVWLITGASQGLGLSLALAALRAGHKILATARTPEKARSQHPEVESLGGVWIELDVTQSDTQARVDAAIREHGGGKIDVVVNNAGYSMVGTTEDLADDEMLLALDTLVVGPLRVIKAALPYMRAQRSGTLVYHGSCLGMRPCPGSAGYSPPKAAGDMLHEVLRLETKSFNIRTLIINSGLFHTGILEHSPMPRSGMGEHYFGEGTVLAAAMPYLMKAQADPSSMMRGDPVKWGERVRELVDKDGVYGSKLANATRILLGADSVILADQQIERLRRETDESREVAATTDFEGTNAVGMAYLAEVAP